MATNTYVALQTQTLSGAASSVSFTSIPQTYTDLVIVANAKANTGGVVGFVARYNGDTGTNYSFTYLNGNGSSASSGRVSNSNVMAFSDLASSSTAAGTTIINIQNYSNSTTYKTAISRGSDANNVAQALVNLWRSTAAITQIDLFPNSGIQFAAGSTFTLYGILKA